MNGADARVRVEWTAVLARSSTMIRRTLTSFMLVVVSACGAPKGPAPTSAKATAPAPRALYRSVHIDHLAPDKFAQFEGARRAWVDAMRAANAHDGRGVFLQVGADTLYNVRSFATYASFDTRNDAINASLAHVPKEAVDRYDRLSDESLVFPHRSEIWRLDDDLSYVPAQGALSESTASFGTVILEDVRPDIDSENRYWNARGEINKALAEARYPLTRLSFPCVYGAGRLTTLVLAASKEALEGAPSVEVVVEKVRGAERAKSLAAEVEASVEKREMLPLVVRHDLTWE